MYKEEEKVIYEEKDGVEVKNSVFDYVGKEGVWALFGRDEEDDAFECLNVGKAKDIGSEILFDVACLHLIPFKEDGDVPYTNQFGFYGDFKYKQGIRPQVYLYPFIAKKYKELNFMYVHDKSDSEVEKKYAKDHCARFWRNGRSFGS